MVSHPPPDLIVLLGALTRALDARGVPFMLIGGQAVLVHGRPRLTDDIDVTLGLGPDQLDTVLAACTSLGLVPLPEDVRGFVAETFVLPACHGASNLRVDLIFSTLPYERVAISRAVRLEVGTVMVPFASAEDLLIHKLFAARPRDIEDAIGVVRRQGRNIDWPYVERWVIEFSALPGHEDLLARLGTLRAEES